MSSSTLFAVSDSPNLQLVVDNTKKPQPRNLTSIESAAVRKMLDEIEDGHIRRDAVSLSTWDFFVHSTSERPMYGGNPVLEAASAWEFGQQLWTDDEVINDSDENENLRQMRKLMRSGRL